jgi:hypothetical protein
MPEHGERIYRDLNGNPVAAVQWTGDSTDTSGVEQFLARHLDRPDRFRVTVSVPTDDQATSRGGYVLRIAGGGWAGDAAAGWWVLIHLLDLPRQDRYVETVAPATFAAVCRDGAPS